MVRVRTGCALEFTTGLYLGGIKSSCLRYWLWFLLTVTSNVPTQGRFHRLETIEVAGYLQLFQFRYVRLRRNRHLMTCGRNCILSSKLQELAVKCSVVH
jgi:hypothetical protein